MPGFANPADTAIYAKLAADTTLTALLAGGTALPSVYHAVIPQDAALPAVVFNSQAPSTPARTFTAVAFENALYTVKAVTEGRNQLAAGTIAARIDTLLDGPALTYTGFTHMGCQRVQEIDYTESAAGGIRYNHRGATYRLRAY